MKMCSHQPFSQLLIKTFLFSVGSYQTGNYYGMDFQMVCSGHLNWQIHQWCPALFKDDGFGFLPGNTWKQIPVRGSDLRYETQRWDIKSCCIHLTVQVQTRHLMEGINSCPLG